MRVNPIDIFRIVKNGGFGKKISGKIEKFDIIGSVRNINGQISISINLEKLSLTSNAYLEFHASSPICS